MAKHPSRRFEHSFALLKNQTYGPIFFLRFIFQAVAIAILVGGTFVGAAPETHFTNPVNPLNSNEEGVITLKWAPVSSTEDLSYELQQSSDPSFPDGSIKDRYQGVDRGSVLTGFPEGSYHFRVRSIDSNGISGEWSSPVSFEIKYKPDWLVIALLTTGIIVFSSTLVTLICCHIKSTQST